MGLADQPNADILKLPEGMKSLGDCNSIGDMVRLIYWAVGIESPPETNVVNHAVEVLSHKYGQAILAAA